MASLDTHYSARDIEPRILAAIRAAGLNPESRLSAESLGSLDHFHTGGVRASRELLELAQIRNEDRVLDIGAGWGSARLLASTLLPRSTASNCRPTTAPAQHWNR
jgi:hypothetical protein